MNVSSIFSGSERTIDFVLARRATLREFKRGAIARNEICDAQPELIRAAKNVGVPKTDACPVCEEHVLVNLLYAFGSKLPAHGRCLTNEAEIEKLIRSNLSTKIYQVEVCFKCGWNHLDRVITPPSDNEKSA